MTNPSSPPRPAGLCRQATVSSALPPAATPQQKNAVPSPRESNALSEKIIDLTNSDDESVQPCAAAVADAACARKPPPPPEIASSSHPVVASVPTCEKKTQVVDTAGVSRDSDSAHADIVTRTPAVEPVKCALPAAKRSRVAEKTQPAHTANSVQSLNSSVEPEGPSKTAESVKPATCVERTDVEPCKKSTKVAPAEPTAPAAPAVRSIKRNRNTESAESDIQFVSEVRSYTPADLADWRWRLLAITGEAYDRLSSAKGDAITYTTPHFANNEAIDLLVRAADKIGARSVIRLATAAERKQQQADLLLSTEEGSTARARCVVMSLRVGELAQLTKPALQRLMTRSVDEIFTGRIFKLCETIAIPDDPSSPPQRPEHPRQNYMDGIDRRDKHASRPYAGKAEHPHHAIARRRRDARHEEAVRHWMKHNEHGSRGMRYGGASGRYDNRRHRNRHGGHNGFRRGPRQQKKYMNPTLSPAMQKEQDALADYFRQDHSHVRDPVANAASADMTVAGQVADAKERQKVLAESAIWDGGRKRGRRGEDSGADAAPALTSQTSRGYNLLTRMGWREGSGLGSSGQGRVAPIEARVRDYRAGVGL